MRDKGEIFKKQRLPVHDTKSGSEEDDLTLKGKTSSKNSVTSFTKKTSKRRCDRENKKKQSSSIRKRRKIKLQPEQTVVKKMSKIEERRSFINSKNRLTVGLYNQGRQSHTIYRSEPGISKLLEKVSKNLKEKTKEDMSKVLDCSSFQIKPLQASITQTTFDDFSLPDSGSSQSPNDMTCDVDSRNRGTFLGSTINYEKCHLPDEIQKPLPDEPQLENITDMLMNALQPSETFCKDHLKDIRNELKEYHRKSTLQQDYCDNRVFLETSNHPSTTPVCIGKICAEGKKLFPSSISRISCMSHDLFEMHYEEECDYDRSSQQENIEYDEIGGDQYDRKEQKQGKKNDTKPDILSITESDHEEDLVQFSNYASISPLKKPSLHIPTPPDKLLPRKLF